MKRVLLCPLGSHGDVHPFIAIGKELQTRGCDVHLVTSEHFRPLAERHGFAFAPIGTEENFQSLIRDPDLWHPTRSMRAIYGNRDWLQQQLRQSHDHLVERHRPGETVAVAGVLAFGIRTACEKLGIPLATAHLQPGALYSVESPPVYATLHMKPWWPRWLKRAFYWYADRRVIDRLAGPTLNAFRAELGLPQVSRLLGRWVNSPDRVLFLFPEWFGSAPDWPANGVHTGFLRYDQAEADLPKDVEAFLDAGDAPIVWTFGSAMRQGKPFFETAVAACEVLNRRGLLVCRGREQVPANLPPGVKHADYAPFSVIFPRVAAVVHHGGIGTTAQALAAGVPQLIMPLAFDQPDNAHRLARLGVGRTLWPKRFNGPNAAAELETLLGSDACRQACDALARRLDESDPLGETCNHIEALFTRRA